jgi:hypothetical protein
MKYGGRRRDIIDNSVILSIATWLLPSGMIDPFMLSYFIQVAKVLSNKWRAHWQHKVVYIFDRNRGRVKRAS